MMIKSIHRFPRFVVLAILCRLLTDRLQTRPFFRAFARHLAGVKKLDHVPAQIPDLSSLSAITEFFIRSQSPCGRWRDLQQRAKLRLLHKLWNLPRRGGLSLLFHLSHLLLLASRIDLLKTLEVELAAKLGVVADVLQSALFHKAPRILADELVVDNDAFLFLRTFFVLFLHSSKMVLFSPDPFKPQNGFNVKFFFPRRGA